MNFQACHGIDEIPTDVTMASVEGVSIDSKFIRELPERTAVGTEWENLFLIHNSCECAPNVGI